MRWKITLGVLVVVAGTLAVFVVRNVTTAPTPISQTPRGPAMASPGSGTPVPEKKISQGSFIHIDAIHQGDGQAVVYETAQGPQLSFENFTVTPGPDVHVYLSKNPQATKDKQLGEYVTLGKLQATKGDQTYQLPADYREYHSVIVYCRAFKVPFTIADLT